MTTLLDSPFDPATQRHLEQIRRIARPSNHSSSALGLSVLHAFPDRVARRRKDNQLLLASGGSAVLACDTRTDFLVALDIESRSEHALPLVRLFCAIEPDWLIDKMTERSGVEWNRTAERVEAVSALLYENLVIEETRSGAPDPDQAVADDAVVRVARHAEHLHSGANARKALRECRPAHLRHHDIAQ